jgi:ribosomal protein L11 methyltransferase
VNMPGRNQPAPPSLPRRWLVLTVPAPPRGEEHLLVDALRRLGARAVEREGERFVAHLPPTANVNRLLRRAEVAVRASTSLRDPEITWGWQEHGEWLDRRSAQPEPRRVTEHMVVAPAAHEPTGIAGDIVVRLHPGVAFGTAEHATTRSCLRLLERLVEPDSRIADIGAGSGILAVAAALLGARGVVALEADPLASAAAEENVALNGVTDRVTVRQGRVRPGDLASMERFHGIVANLELGIVRPLIPPLHRALVPGGWLILSGILLPERDTLLRAARDAALELEEEDPEDGWWTGWFRPAGQGNRQPVG